MTMEQRDELDEQLPVAEQGYEAPAIESVITPDDLAREVQYAGTSPSDGIGPG